MLKSDIWVLKCVIESMKPQIKIIYILKNKLWYIRVELRVKTKLTHESSDIRTLLTRSYH